MACFRGIVCGALRFRGCAFPLGMLSRSIFSPLLAFRVFGCVLVGVNAVNALVSRFKGFGGFAWLGVPSFSALFRPPLRLSVML